jgi:hypothetical protein
MSTKTYIKRNTYRLSVILNPVGTWTFVGSVPASLAYEGDEEIITIAAKQGPSIAQLIAKKRNVPFKTVSFQSKQAAIAFANAEGYEVFE